MFIPKAIANHKTCTICRKTFKSKKKTTKQRIVGNVSSLDAFVETGIFIPKGARSCSEHFLNGKDKFKVDDLKQITPLKNSTFLKNPEITQLLLDLRVYKIHIPSLTLITLII